MEGQLWVCLFDKVCVWKEVQLREKWNSHHYLMLLCEHTGQGMFLSVDPYHLLRHLSHDLLQAPWGNSTSATQPGGGEVLVIR